MHIFVSENFGEGLMQFEGIVRVHVLHGVKVNFYAFAHASSKVCVELYM